MAQFGDSEFYPIDIEGFKIALAQLSGEVEGMKATCIRRFESEMSELKQLLSKIRTKNISLHDFDIRKIEAEKEGIQKSVKQCTLRRDVFLRFCSSVEDEAIKLESAAMTSLVSDYPKVRSRFDRECQRFDKALPIYSERLNILQIIENHQTCILIGETGSGKSTQLVQYLYEAGYSENGLIACTQPRKLAASSLAQHVSTEVGEAVGNTYGFASVKSRRSSRTKVLFMTDHTLLNECIADRNLSQYSCLVIDEAHERSIHTDILIALIKRCLPNRQDLKVIITSATINPTLFSTYFGGPHECPVIEVSGRTYPVDVFWEVGNSPLVSKDYVAESVTKAYNIHIDKKGEEGDILVFLTGPAEIERACKRAQDALKSDSITLPLHGKLQPEEQQKVFEMTPGKRKVVFSTNVAETSVTIPGIKYVIDTGLSKEMCYDSQKNMNSLEIRPISKSSANQRKGRAGRTSYGECYRLFSEDDYANMRDDSVPEILRITLAFAVIKLYEFGIEDIHSFEFVDAPNKKALNDAVENLKFLGAIKNGKLTELGRKMAVLPLEPNLSKILLDSIKEGVGAEGAAAVAISTLAGRVFFRPSKEELQSQTDHKRLPFCLESGDQMTYLNTYSQWSLQDKSDRSKWCAENFVNGKSMRMVEQMVNELILILGQYCDVDFPRQSLSLDKALLVLPRLFFDAFLPNLSIHLGHDKIGYWCEKLPTEQLIIHYGSSLRYLSSSPQCIIFEKTQKTSQHFLLQVLPVPNEWIEDAVATGKIPCHPCKSSLYQFYQISTLLFSNIGPTVLSRLREKYSSGRRVIIQEFSGFDIQPLFEYPNARERGDFSVYAQESFLEQIKSSVNAYIEQVKAKLKADTYEDGVVGSNDDVKVVLGAGGRIQQILMPEEFRSVVVLNLNSHFKFRAIEELKQIGECSINDSASKSGNVKLFVKFQKSTHATTALNHKFRGFEDPNVLLRRQHTKNKKTCSLFLTWPRRELRDFAFIKVSEEQYSSLICPRFGRSYYLQESATSIKFQHDTKKRSIKVMRIPPNADKEYVKSKFLDYWPMLSDIEIYLNYNDPFDETPADCLRKKQDLDDIIAAYIPRKSYYVDFHNPISKNVVYKACIQFDSSAQCLHVQEQLNQKHPQYHTDMSLTLSVRYHSKLFTVIESTITDIAGTFTPEEITFNERDKWGNVFVKITAKNVAQFTKAKEAVSSAIEPTKRCFTENKFNKYTSTPVFLKVVREIQNKTSTFMKLLNFNMCDNIVEIYGSAENKAVAKQTIEKHLVDLEGNFTFFEINLKQFKPGLVKHLVLQYGASMARLIEDWEGIRAVQHDSKQHILALFCTNEAYTAFVQSLSSYTGSNTSIEQVIVRSESPDSNDCCVCYQTHDSNKTFYRLEICGHVYCRDCVEMQLAPTAIQFPVKCAACEEEIVWKDFESLFRSKVVKLQDVKSAALRDFVAANSNVYHHCSTPDCDMVYLITTSGERFVCSQCGAHICTRCHENWHEGYDTCSEYENRNRPDDGILFWLRESKDRKECPKCSVPIEKAGGCLHVHCKCNAHICWTCLNYYSTSSECYGHLRSSHGGY